MTEPAWKARKAEFDAMDDGHGPYMHGELLAGLTVPPEWPEFLVWADRHLGQGYSLACCDGDLIDRVTSYCFTGYLAGRRHNT
jgi:hypothetical protein